MDSRREMLALVQVLESRPDLVSGAYKDHQTLSEEWQDVADELNAIGVFKHLLSGAEAKKKWFDFKYRVKKKLYAMHRAQLGKKGATTRVFFNAADDRVLKLMRLAGTPHDKELSHKIPIPPRPSKKHKKDGSIRLQVPALSTNSIIPSGSILVQAPSSSSHTTFPSGHIIVSGPVPILTAPTPVVRKPVPILPVPDPILPDLCTNPCTEENQQTERMIKQEIPEMIEIEVEPLHDDSMDATYNASNVSRIGNQNSLDKTCNTSGVSLSRNQNHLSISQRPVDVQKTKKLVKKSEFELLADIEKRKLALLEEEIKIKREHLKFQEKKTLIMEEQLAISKEQLAVSKEQLAVSKQVLKLKYHDH